MYYSKEELKNIGFSKVGKNVKVSKFVNFYSFKGEIGNNSRIDDYVILKGNIKIGKNVHISSFNYFAAVKSKIEIGDYTGISANVSIFAVTDDYLGNFLTNPTVNEKFRKTLKAPVIVGQNVSIGAGSILLPKIKIGHSASIAAMSLVNKNVKSGHIFQQLSQLRYFKIKNFLIKKKKIKKFNKLNSTI